MSEALKKRAFIEERDIILVNESLARFMEAGYASFTPQPVVHELYLQMTQKDTAQEPNYSQRIRLKLTDALKPTILEITDNSERHIGHAGHDPRGETHFHVKIVSEIFIGLNRLDRQRLVYTLLAEELRERVHALTMEALAPAEYNLKL